MNVTLQNTAWEYNSDSPFVRWGPGTSISKAWPHKIVQKPINTSIAVLIWDFIRGHEFVTHRVLSQIDHIGRLPMIKDLLSQTSYYSIPNWSSSCAIICHWYWLISDFSLWLIFQKTFSFGSNHEKVAKLNLSQSEVRNWEKNALASLHNR